MKYRIYSETQGRQRRQHGEFATLEEARTFMFDLAELLHGRKPYYCNLYLCPFYTQHGGQKYQRTALHCDYGSHCTFLFLVEWGKPTLIPEGKEYVQIAQKLDDFLG